MTIRVLLVDDHALFRQALRTLLANDPDIMVVGELEDAAQLLATVTRLQPDVVLLDISMPGISGIAAARDLLARDARQRILVLSAFQDRRVADGLARLGVRGYLDKHISADALRHAIATVAAGGSCFSPELAPDRHTQAGSSMAAAPDAPYYHELGAREQQILCLVAQGKSSPQIARELHIAASTVDVHRRNIMAKLDLHSVAELTLYAVAAGLVCL